MFNTFRNLTVLAAAIVFMGAGCLSLGGGSAPGTSGPAGVFVSTDKGETWQPHAKLPKADGTKELSAVSVYRLFPDPDDPKALYWASRNSGYFFSYDEGFTWQQPLGELTNGFVYGLAVHPEDRCTIFATNGFLIYRSDDCSRSWVEVYREARSQTRVNSLVFRRDDPHQIYGLLTGGDLLESADGGVNWRVLHRFDMPMADIFVSQHDNNFMYAASRVNGLFRSLDGGVTWQSLQDNMNDFTGSEEYRRFYVHPTEPGVLYWVSTYGILRSDDNGDTWREIPLITPPGSAQIYGFAVNPFNDQELYYTATINNRSTFYKSDNGGQGWTTKRLPSGQIPTQLFVHHGEDKQDIIFVGFTIPPSN